MSDEKPFYAPDYKIPKVSPRQRPRELAWEGHYAGRFWKCELRDSGEYGVEAQISRDNDLFVGRLWR